jgi:hypothetical protein
VLLVEKAPQVALRGLSLQVGVPVGGKASNLGLTFQAIAQFSCDWTGNAASATLNLKQRGSEPIVRSLTAISSKSN